MRYLKTLALLLDKKSKITLSFLVLFSVFVAVLETIGISAIMPFIDIATNFSKIHTSIYYSSLYEFFNFSSDIDFAIAIGLALVVFYIFRAIMVLVYTYALHSFGNNLLANLKQRLVANYLFMFYKDYINNNYALMQKTINEEADRLRLSVIASLDFIVEVFVVIFIYTLMLIANAKITLVFSAILIFKLLFLLRPLSKKTKQIGTQREQNSSILYKLLNSTFRNFKYIKLQSSRFLANLNKEVKSQTLIGAKITTKHALFSTMPKLFLESIGFSMVILLLVYLLFKNQTSVLYILPTLSLFVLALYRLLPSINRIIISYNTIMFYHRSIDIISNQMKSKQENTGNASISFNKQIKLKDVCFSYNDNTQALDNINLVINKGDKIALIGKSGSGKSTLIDLIIGLHQATKGSVFVDDVLLDYSNIQQYRSLVGYIPQDVYLFDGTVAQNVCFTQELDKDKLKKVLKQADIYDFLQSKQGIDTLVGDGGVSLSGGQKQRIAIARALYTNPEILVLDEATSALDTQTEKAIMQNIYEISKDKTLIIVAHRLSTIEGCDKVYNMKNAKIIDTK